MGGSWSFVGSVNVTIHAECIVFRYFGYLVLQISSLTAVGLSFTLFPTACYPICVAHYVEKPKCISSPVITEQLYCIADYFTKCQTKCGKRRDGC